MNRIFLSLLALLVLLFSNNAMATFTKAEIAAVQPLVNELMGDSLRDYKARKISGSQVGDNALKLAKEAESDVAKFICMKGAISYYVRDKAYDKAADTIELMMSKFKDLSPETLSEIVALATRRVNDKSASRLFEIRKAINIKIASSKKLRAIKAQLAQTPADKRLICRYAELMAVENKWDEALKMFAKMGGDLGKISQDTLNGSASSVQIAEFWWDYKSMEEDAKDAIRLYSLMHYKNAIEKGELVGLKKTLAERRIAEVGSAAITAVAQSELNKKLYCVIDLSGGYKATKFPVSYLEAMPKSGWSDVYKTTKLVLKRIDPGSLKMASNPDRVVTVHISKPYYIGVFELTRKQCELILGWAPSHFAENYKNPAAGLSYQKLRGSKMGCEWPKSNAVDADSLVGCLRLKTGLCFDIPTEAQWEYASRAGADFKLSEERLKKVAHYGAKGEGPRRVGSFLPNPWGLYDVLGNINEWCRDWFGDLEGGTDPVGAQSNRKQQRVCKGAAWVDSVGALTFYYRIGREHKVDRASFGARLSIDFCDK